MITILVCSTLLGRDACVEEAAFSVTRTPVVEGMLCEISAPQFIAASGLLDANGDGVNDDGICAKIVCPR
jgi:hypothetical protein